MNASRMRASQRGSEMAQHVCIFTLPVTEPTTSFARRSVNWPTIAVGIDGVMTDTIDLWR